jgi:hypothetical protein
MKKLSLDLNALRVESFDATPRATTTRGTVRGNDSAATTTTYPETTFCAVEHSGDPCVNTLETACGISCLFCI